MPPTPGGRRGPGAPQPQGRPSGFPQRIVVSPSKVVLSPERVREHREASGLTQRGVDIATAERGHRVSRATVERVEQAGSDGAEVLVQTAEALAAIFGVALRDLLLTR